MSSILQKREMADTLKDGLLLGRGIRHVTAMSQLTRGVNSSCLPT